MELNEVTQSLSSPIRKVWNAIGSDAYDFCECNEDAIEFCIDADRLSFIADDAIANNILRGAIKKFGYDAVCKDLTQKVLIL
jgi:hypothetical protein